MRRALTFLVFALSFSSFPAFPQQAPTSGSIEGIVISAETEQPIANAQVTLTPISDLATAPAGAGGGAFAQAVGANSNAGAIAPVTTGSDGKFAFKDLKPATYRVAAAATGFVRQEYGQRALNGPGRLLFVVAGQAINGANIRITPTGTISGRILDENGQPATGAPVRLLRAVYNLQGKTYQSAGSAAADDRGNYRIFGVTPGRYYLMAGTLPSVMNLFGPRGGPLAGSARYSLVYYPNVSRLDQAATVEVKAGDESSFDVRLKRETQTFHVRGRVINPSGSPFPQDMTAMLGYSTFSSSGAANKPDSFDPATGMFDVSGVPPGEFTLNIVRAAPPPRGRGGIAPILEQQAQRAMGLAASAPLHVTNADIDGLVLTLMAGATAQGKFIVEGQPISAVPNFGQLRFNIRSVMQPTGMGLPTTSTIAADGSFQVAGLREGEYRAQLGGDVPGFYVKSIKYGDEDILGRTFKFGGGVSRSFEVVLKAGMQTVAGTVTDSLSRPVPGIAVVFIPAQRERFDLFRNTNTDQTGRFTLMNLVPGEYKVFSWEAVDNNAYMDPDFLGQYEHLGKAISVTESFNSRVDVKLIPAQ